METPHNSIGHETEDASIKGIVLTGIGLVVAALLAGLIVYAIFQYLAVHPATRALVNPMAQTAKQQFSPGPRIEDHPSLELKELRSGEDRLLSTYGWTDKKTGVVRIPIDRAMEVQLERGFPVRKKTAATK